MDGEVYRTPCLTSRSLDRRVGARLFFKAENLQRVGAFKFRGATHAVRSLDEESARAGVVTHSSGNHAQALALAARRRGIRATIVMPSNAATVKRSAVEGYGAEIVSCEPTLEARETTVAELLAERGGTLVHPYDDARIVAGQSTAAQEMLEDLADLDVIVTPVGGGGLLSGTLLAARFFAPGVEVWGAEPALADDAARSLESGVRHPALPPASIADGLLSSLGELNFALLTENRVDGIARVSEEEIVAAMRLVMERMKLVIEPSAAVAVAAVLEGRLPVKGRRVGIVLSGGNVDLDRLPWSA